MSSSIIDPILTIKGDRKITVVTVTITAGAQYGTGTAQGLDQVQQVLGAYLYGAGMTVQNGLLASPYISGNVIGVSLAAASGAAGMTAKVLVQGY